MMNIRKLNQSWIRLIESKYFYFAEKYSPLLLSSICTMSYVCIESKYVNINGLPDKFINNSISVNGTLIGFLLTIFTILNTINTRSMRFVRDTGKFKDLISYLYIALTLCIVSLIFGLIRSIIDDQLLSCQMKSGMDYLSIFLVSWSIFAMVRFTLIISLIIKGED